MHQIAPYHRWLSLYDPSFDDRSPFYGKEYNFDLYSETIYGYYIDPAWDFIGSETLYVKVLFVDYGNGYAIIELIGEWNDALHNDIMHLKRNLIDQMIHRGIYQYIVIGENIFNYHGSDDCYYEEWFDDVEDGWIAFVGFRDFVVEEMMRYNIDNYINLGGQLQITNWRTFSPERFFQQVSGWMMRRLGA